MNLLALLFHFQQSTSLDLETNCNLPGFLVLQLDLARQYLPVRLGIPACLGHQMDLVVRLVPRDEEDNKFVLV